MALADREGVESLSMRRLANELDVVPMALYKHVANKEEMLDGMLDMVVAEIDSPLTGPDWKTADPGAHPLGAASFAAPPVGLARDGNAHAPTPTVMAYMDSMIGMFLDGGFSIDLTHHVMHTMGSRLMGFSQELFNDQADEDQPFDPETIQQLGQAFPSIYRIYLEISHDDASVVGSGCDDQFEFEFSLDLILDGIERLQERGTSELSL